jgi:hypothetical protein
VVAGAVVRGVPPAAPRRDQRCTASRTRTATPRLDRAGGQAIAAHHQAIGGDALGLEVARRGLGPPQIERIAALAGGAVADELELRDLGVAGQRRGDRVEDHPRGRVEVGLARAERDRLIRRVGQHDRAAGRAAVGGGRGDLGAGVVAVGAAVVVVVELRAAVLVLEVVGVLGAIRAQIVPRGDAVAVVVAARRGGGGGRHHDGDRRRRRPLGLARARRVAGRAPDRERQRERAEASGWLAAHR